MIISNKIKGKHVALRSVEENDAEFILNLRLDKNNIKFLSPTENNLEKQKDWIHSQKEREGDYYFLYEDFEGNPQGVISIYHIHDNEGEIGRQVGLLNSLYNMEAEYLAMKFAFEHLNLIKIFGTTYLSNSNIYNKSIKLGLNIEKIIKVNGIDSYYMTLSRDTYFNKWLPTMEKYLNKFSKNIK